MTLLLFLLAAAGGSGHESHENHEKMLAILAQIREAASTEEFVLAGRSAEPLRQALKGVPPGASDLERWELLVRLGEMEQTLGREREAVALFTEAYELLSTTRRDIAPEWIARLLFRLGMAHLREGETRNCVAEKSPEACIYPLRGGGIHREREPLRLAIRYLGECIAESAFASDSDLSARWLLNLAFMAVGEYPDGVPEDLRIPLDTPTSGEPFPFFRNVAFQAGVATLSLAGGAVSADFDLDGDLDLLVSTSDYAGQTRLFLNEGDLAFVERTVEAGLEGLFGGLNMVHADYDNDGDVDVLVLRGGWLGRRGRHPNSLHRNNGDGTFTDVTFETGLGETAYPTQTASFGDFDNDGDLDLYVGNETTSEVPEARSELFENRAGVFVDVAESAGVGNDRFAKSAIWGDYDGDGFADLYVSNIHDDNRLYRNQSDGTFVDVAPDLGVVGPKVSFPSWFWDFDNDGVLDLFVAAYEAAISDLAAFRLGFPYPKELASLYRGDGRGGFEDVARDRGLTEPTLPMGANFGDLDGDGYLDFYLGTGSPPYHALMPNVMYWNRGGEKFADVTAAGGFGHLQKGHAVVFADFDEDGDEDVFEQMGGHFPGDKFYDALFENPGFGSRFLTVELFGRESNRSAIGARIRVRVSEKGVSRDVYKHVNSGGTFGGNPLRQTIGLGRADRIEILEVLWPRPGGRQEFRNVPLDASVQILEGSAELGLRLASPERSR